MDSKAGGLKTELGCAVQYRVQIPGLYDNRRNSEIERLFHAESLQCNQFAPQELSWRDAGGGGVAFLRHERRQICTGLGLDSAIVGVLVCISAIIARYLLISVLLMGYLS